MTIKVDEIINWFYSHYKDELVEVHTIKADTLEKCFEQVYSLERSSRYDNERRYEFEDKSLKPKYQAWKDKNVTIEMYYGSATVD